MTGANGQLGNEFRDLAPHFQDYEFQFASRNELPIDDYQQINEYFSTQQPQFCINCAAYTAVDKAEQEAEAPDVFGINADAVEILASICAEHDTRLVHVSTDYVFNGEGSRPYKETDPTNPINIYGASKLMGERYAMESNPQSIIVRSSWVYSSHGKNFVKTMLRLMSERNEISVVEDQVGTPTYAADLAHAILQIISSGKWQPGIYHYANAGVISWFEFALAIKELAGKTCVVQPIPSSQYPVPAKRPMYSALDSGKILQTFGLEAHDWLSSLKNCIGKLA